jgi:hypothetical protein
LHTIPDDESTCWSTRTMGERHGVGKDTVARIWRARKLRPWHVDTFKLSNDPRFEEKLVDVVGLYLDPPERAVVFSFDEKTQCQALDRTQPSLPLKPGRAKTMTHDYKRNGTIDLFAALNVGTGEVLHQTRKKHTAKDVLAFFKWIDLHVPRDLEIHVVLDNLSAHSAPPVTEWLAHPKRRRWHLHYTPTSASWLNLVEGWFAPPDQQAAQARQLRQRRSTHRGHRCLGITLERRPETVRVAHPSQQDHHQGAPRTRRPDPPAQIRDRPLGISGPACPR